MKKLLLTLAALPALAIAFEASAQSAYGYQPNSSYQQNYNQRDNGYRPEAGVGGGMRNRILQLEARLDAGIQSGAVDRREARSLRMQLRDLARAEQQYSYNGLTPQERQDLQGRFRAVRDQLRSADGGRYANDSAYGQGGPYEQAYEQPRDRGVLGTIVDNVLGGGGLRVGQRVSGNLGRVPYGYGDQYRDGPDVYYRSDGSRVYQIDARSNTVQRIYSMNR